MANNLQRGFTLEYDDSLRTRVNCKDCIHADRDGSCNKKGYVFREDGYSFWRKCSYFELDMSVSNANIKLEKAVNLRSGVSISKDINKSRYMVPKTELSRDIVKVFNLLPGRYKQLFAQSLRGDKMALARLKSVVPDEMHRAFLIYYVYGDLSFLKRLINEWFQNMGFEETNKTIKNTIVTRVLFNLKKDVEARGGQASITKDKFEEYLVIRTARCLFLLGVLDDYK